MNLKSTSSDMIVWLKGDEDYAKDFSLDAHTVMEMLNIKRSRLTQISGKELRVGRIKDGRYIKPVYRLEDIKNYKNWTRATATSQKASNIVNKAVDDLKKETQKIIKLSQNIPNNTRNLLEKNEFSFKKKIENENQKLIKNINYDNHLNQKLALNSSKENTKILIKKIDQAIDLQYNLYSEIICHFKNMDERIKKISNLTKFFNSEIKFCDKKLSKIIDINKIFLDNFNKKNNKAKTNSKINCKKLNIKFDNDDFNKNQIKTIKKINLNKLKKLK
jgi:hypothetical protein